MDKSFNDQELSDIMKEIEALEEGFNDEGDAVAKASDVMEELAELDETVSVPTSTHKAPVLPFERKTPATTSKTTAPTSMSFKVQGQMNLELNFEIGGKTVTLEVSETGLQIQMDGGVTFTVPVTDAHSVKKAV